MDLINVAGWLSLLGLISSYVIGLVMSDIRMVWLFAVFFCFIKVFSDEESEYESM